MFHWIIEISTDNGEERYLVTSDTDDNNFPARKCVELLIESGFDDMDDEDKREFMKRVAAGDFCGATDVWDNADDDNSSLWWVNDLDPPPPTDQSLILQAEEWLEENPEEEEE